MYTTLRLFFSFITVFIKVLKPGGAKTIAAENMLLRQQLIVAQRHRKRAPNLTTADRTLFGFLAAMIKPSRFNKCAICIKPTTLLKFHHALIERKYHQLFSRKSHNKPGRKGPPQDIINLIVEMKQRNPRFGYLRIAMQIYTAFGIELDKGDIKCVLDKHYYPSVNNSGPSWLTFLGHLQDSLWSVDFFRLESINIKSHWIMLIMDQFSRRIVGFAICERDLNGTAVCRMFNSIISHNSLPKYLSSDNDPLFQYHQRQANLRILDITEIKSVPYTPISHPFVERLIGTIRREFTDNILFWNKRDLERKLGGFQDYYNHQRAHSAKNMLPPLSSNAVTDKIQKQANDYQWQSHCRGLFQLPLAA